jgi:hypothetical protein
MSIRNYFQNGAVANIAVPVVPARALPAPNPPPQAALGRNPQPRVQQRDDSDSENGMDVEERVPEPQQQQAGPLDPNAVVNPPQQGVSLCSPIERLFPSLLIPYPIREKARATP